MVDHDRTVSDEIRFVQLTPPGSACSIAIGRGLTEMAPGSLDNLQVVIADADATYADLRERGIECEGVADLAVGPLRPLRRPRRQPLGAPGAARLRRQRRRLSPGQPPSRRVTVPSAALRDSMSPVTTDKNSSRSTDWSTVSSTAVTVAVLGTSRSSPISPK